MMNNMKMMISNKTNKIQIKIHKFQMQAKP